MKLRKATSDDTLQVALIVAEALGDSIMERYVQSGSTIHPDDEKRMELLMQVAARTDTLYTWQHCTLAIADSGEVAGGLIAYPGDDYMARRDVTFALVKPLIHFDVERMDAEVGADEYYLDSLAVWPSFRGLGLGRVLMQHGIEQGRSMGRTTVLACAPDNTGAHRLYESLGFRDAGPLFIFGEDYIRMEIT